MSSPIRDFYFGKNILITGATGFIGKALIEKLLRSCNGIQRIYILMRDKKGKSVEQRWNDYITDDIFKLNCIDISGIVEKIVPISGDITLPELGMNEEDRQQLIDHVTIVLHVASNVKANPLLREAIHDNVLGTISIVQLCRQMKKLDTLVYVSTTGLLMHREVRQEIVYSTLVSPEHVIESCEKLTDKQLIKYAELFFPDFPNAYTITKTLAENVIFRESCNFNIAIVRPSAVNPAYREPVPGWVLGINGFSALAFSAALGIMRIAGLDYRSKPGQIPVDFVCNAIIASAWFVSTKRPEELQVYHLTTQYVNTPTLVESMKMLRYNSLSAPSKRVIRPAKVLFLTNMLRVKIESFFKHWVYAYIHDFTAKLFGAKSSLVKMTTIMSKNLTAIKYFTQRGRDNEINNTIRLINVMSPLDRCEFDFDVRAIDWQIYHKSIWMGMRRHLLEENDEGIPRAKDRLRRLRVIDARKFYGNHEDNLYHSACELAHSGKIIFVILFVIPSNKVKITIEFYVPTLYFTPLLKI